jgi:hypothetical protein
LLRGGSSLLLYFNERKAMGIKEKDKILNEYFLNANSISFNFQNNPGRAGDMTHGRVAG